MFALESRLVSEAVNLDRFRQEIDGFKTSFQLGQNNIPKKIRHISITKNAFPEETEDYLNCFLDYCSKIDNDKIRKIFEFSAFSILEEISFTRKDGQYLRWDHRANKSWGKTKFNKGKIYPFIESINKKLIQLYRDLEFGNGNDLFTQLADNKSHAKKPKILQGSSLELMPNLDNNFFDFIMTSPPYCNRYDYTRTYALELIFLGYNDEQVKNLRQEMLSCTVENKEKIQILKNIYGKLNRPDVFKKVVSDYKSNEVMQEVNNVLKSLNDQKLLNNSNIPRMVKNYFLEMAFIIFEMHRVLKKGGYSVMVNDNVRYGGQEIPVDLILSDFAVNFGFELEKIWTLPVGKGNSSQQMGNHGRSELRKCVYVWRKPE
ncbi:hypothetical protein ES705_20152 [subsurface metagenome]